MLSTDVAGAFDTVLHPRLIHKLKKKKIPQWITNWIDSFLKNQSTTLAIHRRTTEQSSVRIGIPQGSPISPILYLCYNAALLELCNRRGTSTSALGIVAFAHPANNIHRTKRLDLGGMTRECEYFHALNWSSEHPRKSALTSTVFEKCCKKGMVPLSPFQDPPADLQRLFTSDGRQEKEFRKHIRQYNAALTFTSMGYMMTSTYWLMERALRKTVEH